MKANDKAVHQKKEFDEKKLPDVKIFNRNTMRTAKKT